MNEKILRPLLNFKFFVIGLMPERIRFRNKLIVLAVIALLIAVPVLAIANPFISEEEIQPLNNYVTQAPEPYLYENFIPPANSFGMGNTTFKDVNVSFYRNWLNNTVSWSLEKSIDNIHWINCDKLLTVIKEWNVFNLSEKHTLIINSDEDAYYRLLLRTDKDKQLNSFEDKSDDTRYDLNFKITDTEYYNISYNWSDFKQSAEYSKASIQKQVSSDLSNKKQFEWDVYTSMKIANGEKFIVDPEFGYTGGGGTNSFSLHSGTYCYMHGTAGQPALSGTVDYIKVYLVDIGASYTVQCGLYEYAGANNAGVLIDTTDTVDITASTPNGWQQFDFADSPSVVAGTDYFLVVTPTTDTYGNFRHTRKTDASGDSFYIKTTTPHAFDDPLTGETSYSEEFWTYAYYTEGGGEPENTAPTQSANNPINNTACTNKQPKLTIYASDPENNTMNITWLSNSSGSQVEFANNLSVNNGTYNQTATNFTGCNTTYWWTVSVSDGNGGYSNQTYHLRTSGPSSITVNHIANGTTATETTPILNVTITDVCGEEIDVYWYENSTGSWELVQHNATTSSNKSFNYQYDNATKFNTTYGWRVAVNNSVCNVSASYNFRTHEEFKTEIELYGLTDDWNMTWRANRSNATGAVPEIVYTNNSGLNYETMAIVMIVNSTERIKNVSIYHDQLNLSTNYDVKINASNITVWVSANNDDWFVPNCDLGYGRGRFAPKGGYIELNFTSWDGPGSPFSYNSSDGVSISENSTILVRLQLNVTDQITQDGYYVNNSVAPGIPSPHVFASNGTFGMFSETEYFTTRADIYSYTAPTINTGVIFSNENPSNNSIDNPVAFTWNITMFDVNGDTFNWSIESYGQSNSANDDTNGSKTLALSSLPYCTNFTVYVNATDGTNLTNETFYFTTNNDAALVFHNPNPANNSAGSGLSFTWNITIDSPNGTQFNWSIESYNGQSSSATGANNGSKTLSISGLDWCINYSVYVNATTDCGIWTNETFYFTTANMSNVTVSNPTPANSSTGQLQNFNYSVDINSLNGEWFNVTMQCNNSQINYTNLTTNGTYYLTLSGLSYGTSYTVWVNVTNNCSNQTRVWFTFDTRVNHAPVVSHEGPTNTSTEVPLNVHFLNVTIEDPDGDTFSYNWHCSNGDGNSAIGNTNGSKIFDISATPLDWCTTYYWWVNVSDGTYETNVTYWFTTAAMPNVTVSNPVPANGTTNTGLAFNYSVDINSPAGEWFNVTIQCNNSNINYTNNTINGTYYLNITGLSYSTEYFVWVNTTNNCSNETRVWFNFSTLSEPIPPTPNRNPNQTNPSPNNTVCVNITQNLTITLVDDDANTMNATWWSNSSGTWIQFASNLSIANGSYYQSNINFSNYCTKYYWSVNVSDGVGGWKNITYSFNTICCPTIHLSYPLNGTSGIDLQPLIKIYANDTCGNNLNITFYENSSGSWLQRQSNYSAANLSHRWNYTWATAGSTIYYFNISINNSQCNITYSYSFTTQTNATPPTASNITITWIHPANNSVDICPCDDSLCVSIANDKGNNMNISFYSPTTLMTYVLRNVTNGTYCMCSCVLSIVVNNYTYQWSVNVSQYGNGTIYNQSKTYTFKTAWNYSNCTSNATSISGTERDYIIGLIGIIGIIGLLGYLKHKRRRR